MKDTNPLVIDDLLKKRLNKHLADFRSNRLNAVIEIQKKDIVKTKKSKGSILNLLFKEYNSMNDLVKDFSSHMSGKKSTA